MTSTSAVGGQAWAQAAELEVTGAGAQVPGVLDDVALESRLVVTPTTLAPGGQVSFTGGGFAPGAVTVRAGATTTTVTADANGFVTGAIAVPTAQAPGPLSVTATQGELSATAAVTVTGPTATAPSLADIADRTVEVGTPISVAASATGTAPIRFTSSALPAGLALKATTGGISGTPTAVGTTKVTLTATNAAGSDSATFTIAVTAAPDRTGPVITVVAAILGEVGTAIAPVTVRATDPSGPLTYARTGVPGLTIDPNTGAISGTPTTVGSHTGTVLVTDAEGNESTTTFRVTVKAKPTPPPTGPGKPKSVRTVPYTKAWLPQHQRPSVEHVV